MQQPDAKAAKTLQKTQKNFLPSFCAFCEVFAAFASGN
jgi:hypothetical protein